ncbi:MAG: NAD(P)/FAD-dependent oxidoreductase [Myxococcota bacterium]
MTVVGTALTIRKARIMDPQEAPTHDVIVVGGGPAGLGAAMSLGRLRRTVAVVDDQRPRNAPSNHVNNFPGHDGIDPRDWRRKVRDELTRYASVSFVDDRVADIEPVAGGFRATLVSGAEIPARKVMLGYGMVDVLPPLPGLREAWGTSVLHCPFCHGYEVAGQPLGLVGNVGMFSHLAPMLAGLTEDLILFTHHTTLTDEQRRDLDGFPLVTDEIAAVVQRTGQVEGVRLVTGETVPRRALFLAASLPLTLQSDVGVKLGCRLTPTGHVAIDERGQTSVAGVFAAGDAVAFSSVLQSAASGSLAGASLCFELAHEDHGARAR